MRGQTKSRRTAIILGAAFIIFILCKFRYEYFDVYALSLNGKIEAIHTDIKENMTITVAKEDHNIAHYWPKLQQHAEVGDSVYKKPKAYEIILVKKKTQQRIVCAYK